MLKMTQGEDKAICRLIFEGQLTVLRAILTFGTISNCHNPRKTTDALWDGTRRVAHAITIRSRRHRAYVGVGPWP